MPIRILLKHGRDKLPLNRHAWVFSGAIARIDGEPSEGEIVEVRAHDGQFIAYAQYHSQSKIMLRLLEWDQKKPVDDHWWREMVDKAVTLRNSIAMSADTDVCRLIHAEGDGLPGLVVDRFGTVAVLQSATAGMDLVKKLVAKILLDTCSGLRTVIEKSDGDGRTMEGLAAVHEHLAGEPAPAEIVVKEKGLLFAVDPAGQKTGFYADQRENRARIEAYCAGADILDLCSFSGAFSVHALKHGAATAILCDSSSAALSIARRNMALNGIDESRCVTACENVFEYSRELVRAGRQFDLVVLDPPKLMPARRDREEASSGYKDLNLQALKLVKSGGILFTFSCSGGFSHDDLRMAVAFAAKDAKRDVQVLEQLHQGPDHPIRVSVPEAEYLKGLICRVW